MQVLPWIDSRAKDFHIVIRHPFKENLSELAPAGVPRAYE
jgi:hypothetical protein